jgi:hypothetical protein
MEQKVPKHRPYSLRDLAKRRKVSHTTVRRQDRSESALLALGGALARFGLGIEVVNVIQSKQIRISQEPLCQWSRIARADPWQGKHIYDELMRNPDTPLWRTNAFIRMCFDPDLHPEIPPISDEERDENAEAWRKQTSGQS